MQLILVWIDLVYIPILVFWNQNLWKSFYGYLDMDIWGVSTSRLRLGCHLAQILSRHLLVRSFPIFVWPFLVEVQKMLWIPVSDIWIWNFRRLNWFYFKQKENRLKYAYFRRLKHLIQTSELCSGNLYISRFRRLNHLFQTSEIAVFCLFAYSLENSNLNRFVMILFVVIIYYDFDDSFLGIFEYPFRWILYRFRWIFIHIFVCEF